MCAAFGNLNTTAGFEMSALLDDGCFSFFFLFLDPTQNLLVTLFEEFRPLGQTPSQTADVNKIQRVLGSTPFQVDIVNHKLNIWRDPIFFYSSP